MQECVVSITGLSLAFCTIDLSPIAGRSSRKAAFKSPEEAGSVFISDTMGNFFHAHVAIGSKLRCSAKPAFAQPLSHRDAGLVLEQALQIRRAQVELKGQITDGELLPRIDHNEDLSHARIHHFAREEARRGKKITCCARMESNGVATIIAYKAGTQI
jgi:hypothetical protein